LVFAAARDNEYLYVCLRCVMNPTSETSFRTDVACRYYFWFDHDKLVQMEVGTWDRWGAVGFTPSIRKAGVNGEQTFALPISEEDLTSMFGPIQSRLWTG